MSVKLHPLKSTSLVAVGEAFRACRNALSVSETNKFIIIKVDELSSKTFLLDDNGKLLPK